MASSAISNRALVPPQMHDSEACVLDDPLITLFHAAQGRRAMKIVADMETHFAPAEMVSFGRALAVSDHPARAVFLQRESFVELLAAKRVQPFQRSAISPDVSFYSDGGPPTNKTLVVGFGGMGGRLGLPIGNILQVMDASRMDMVMLRDPLQRNYAFGAGSFAPDFASLIASLRIRFRPDSYCRLVTIGNSMGGTASLRAGFWLDAERAIGIGARRSNDDLMLVLRRGVGPAFDPFCDCLRDRPHRGLLVYAGACAPDVDAATQMEANGAGRRVIFVGMGEHNLISRFWAMRELGAFLDLLLNGRLVGDRHTPAPPIVIGRTWLPRLRAGLKRRIGHWTGRANR